MNKKCLIDRNDLGRLLAQARHSKYLCGEKHAEYRARLLYSLDNPIDLDEWAVVLKDWDMMNRDQKQRVDDRMVAQDYDGLIKAAPTHPALKGGGDE